MHGVTNNLWSSGHQALLYMHGLNDNLRLLELKYMSTFFCCLCQLLVYDTNWGISDDEDFAVVLNALLVKNSLLI